MSAVGSIILLHICGFVAQWNWAADALQTSWNKSSTMHVALNDDEEYVADVALLSSSATEAVRRKPVVWLHLHKAAGTFICKLAKAQHEHLVQPETTCNLHPYDHVLPGVPAKVDAVEQMGMSKHRMSCAQRAKYYRDNAFTWGQIEREYNLEDLGCKDSFLYGIMIRNPMSLMLSVLNFNKWHADKLVPWLHDARFNPENTCGEACEHEGWGALGWQLFDNFAVRSLNGYDGWQKPPGQVTAKDLERAKRHLQAMDVVMVLEDLSQDKVQLEKVFGWKKMSLGVVRNTSYLTKFTEAQSGFLQELNSFDVALYEFGREIAKQRRR